ncbi:MAG: flagellar biosynthesis switch protein [Bdellovibrio sp. CG10_big_fil_rev_8_21_14_0_10_47_8]|nr:MAG: flagellar biosynthesis switch protein [Bdellovibrio sp. CG10_big_fil_rev_8_21_14_0_10_47_8]
MALKIRNRTKTICITSGKGGVGKTTVVSNMAYALALRGKRVLIFDGDLGMANVDIMFGVKPDGNILDVLHGEKEIDQVLVPLAPNIALIPGGSGVVELSRLNAFERRSLLDAVSTLDYHYDYLLIDTAPGIADNVLYLNSASQVSSVIITPDPSSLADSYALIKVLHQEYKENNFSIICNQVRDETEGLQLFNRFNDVVNRFLSIGLDYWGALPMDNLYRKSTQNQRLIMKHEPQSEAAKYLLQISRQLESSLEKQQDKAGLQFFWEQVVGVA